MINITIDGKKIQAEAGMTILEAAKLANISIPTLCHHPDQKIKSICRVCVVEIEGQGLLQASCSYPVAEGMVVHTTTPKVRRVRENVLELILAHHPQDCLVCGKNGTCELQDLTRDLNIRKPLRYEVETRSTPIDDTSGTIVRDAAKCVVCGRCIEACNDVQTVGVLSKENRGFETIVVPPYGKNLVDTTCVNCGQCVQVCPVGALTIHDDTDKIYDARKASKVIVAQVAPSVRVNLAEALGEEPGSVSVGRIVTAMKQLGFDYVFDSDFSADLTIMEEGYELVHRIQNGGTLPMITSCCPAWVKFCETFSPKYTDHLSTAKSPQQMFGSVIKTYFAEKAELNPANIYSVSIMPCTAKKFEAKREEMNDSGYQDVDLVLTVQELARMIRSAGISFKDIAETEFDMPFGLGSGAGAIFGITGGVTEAALRTLYEVITGKDLEKVEFNAVRGYEGIKEATIDLDGLEVNIAIVHSLGNAREIMRQVRSGNCKYHFIEIMACPGGCVGGGGNAIRNWKKVEKRTEALYQVDANLPIRKSHENPAIKAIYEEYLEAPLGEKSHKLLHTKYSNRQDILR